MKKEKIVICNNMDEPKRDYAKWNMTDTEKQMLNTLPYV
jgi:hypothetical protein